MSPKSAAVARRTTVSVGVGVGEGSTVAVGGVVGEGGIAVAVAVAVALSVFLAQGYTRILSRSLSSRHSFDILESVRKPGEKLGVLGRLGAGARSTRRMGDGVEGQDRRHSDGSPDLPVAPYGRLEPDVDPVGRHVHRDRRGRRGPGSVRYRT